MTSPTNRMSGYAYNQAYDTASERNSIFWDALSMASGSDRNSIALSIYHSVPELHQDENDNGGGHQHRMNGSDKVRICQTKVKSDFVTTSILFSFCSIKKYRFGKITKTTKTFIKNLLTSYWHIMEVM